MKLPKQYEIPKDVLQEENEYDGAVADFLSDIFGFCVNSLEIKDNMASIINWDTSE